MLIRMNGLLCLTIFKGLLLISSDRKSGVRTAPQGERKMKPLGRLSGACKTISPKQINSIRKTIGVPFWQRNFSEHAIRDDYGLNRIREYITTNPLRWDLDRENHQAQGRDEFDNWLATFKKPPARAIAAPGAVGEPTHEVRSKKMMVTLIWSPWQ